jgi:hypothetical protein
MSAKIPAKQLPNRRTGKIFVVLYLTETNVLVLKLFSRMQFTTYITLTLSLFATVSFGAILAARQDDCGTPITCPTGEHSACCQGTGGVSLSFSILH